MLDHLHNPYLDSILYRLLSIDHRVYEHISERLLLEYHSKYKGHMQDKDLQQETERT